MPTPMANEIYRTGFFFVSRYIYIVSYGNLTIWYKARPLFAVLPVRIDNIMRVRSYGPALQNGTSVRCDATGHLAKVSG